MVHWVYFLHDEEIISLYKKQGGKLGTFNPEDPEDIQHARRAIYRYLPPGPVRVWYASLDNKDGIAFFVGKPLRDPRKAFKLDLAGRCYKMFGRSPDRCKVLSDGFDLKWDLFLRNRTTPRLELVEFLVSDREGDMYPLTQEEYASLTSSDNQSTISSMTQ
ncbi:unnamed protein product [Rhizoctonia solani]|uniref:Uncharacterized protein n=2 Tax=Rhizoctonia solani TaxID=456999 RepID=A0A8H2XRB2_9AGAM|nr:hypothetical protein RSOL_038240 [Rhizoctonia solani AG-3 Rhs1AP]CAE6433395.1 unnamed protein product [Rhizoctonia solani]CAE6443848.1 unnamed protein product [Rhizoctonia solani]